MFWIAFLILMGMLFLLAEVLVLPGVSVGAILSLVCYGGAIYMAFNGYGAMAGSIVIGVIVVVSILLTIYAMRSKTWQRFSLKQNIDSVSNVTPQCDDVKVGDCGIALSRLSPMGKVVINGKTYEAKSTDVYIDQKSQIEVVGFENSNVIVKRVENR